MRILDHIELGNMNAKRDWGHSEDYVKAMWLMLQQESPDDYVIATNETRTVREFVEIAFKRVGIDINWEGMGVDEIGVDAETGRTLVSVNPAFFRPAEVELLLGDCTKAEKKLGWTREVSFSELVQRMVDHDMKIISEGLC